MTLDQIIITIVGLLGIAFTYWFFLGKKQKIVQVTSSVNIMVEGGYTPNTISIPQGKTTTLTFTRKDPSSCLEEVVLPDFNIRKSLPLNKSVSIALTPQKIGTFTYSCGMNMYHGRIVVRSS